MANYNRLAPYYDRLARIVFGAKLEEAKSLNLQYFLDCERILIIGGGSGAELEYFERNAYKGEIIFIEPSIVFLERAQRKVSHLQVKFIKEKWPFEDIKTKVDGIITHFYFDQFDIETAKKHIEKASKHLKEGGIWSFVDFKDGEKLSSRLFIRFMYLFFRITTGLKNDRLANYENLFLQSKFFVVESENKYRPVKSILFKKSHHEKFEIREADPSDIKAIKEIFTDAILNLTGSQYNQAEQDVWIRRWDEQQWLKRIKKQYFIMILYNDSEKPSGFGSLSAGGHIDVLYIKSSDSKKGLGSKIIENLIQRAISKGISKITVDASKTSKRLFRKFNFRVIKKNKHPVEDQVLVNYRMEFQIKATQP